jgi:serine protease Do
MKSWISGVTAPTAGWLRQGLVVVLIMFGPSARGQDSDIRRDPTVRAVERVMPAVVNIRTKTIVERSGFYEDLLRDFYGPYNRRRPADQEFNLGSGVIIDPAGYVLTSLHVVQRANQIWVKLADGKVYEAEEIGGSRKKDVALLRLRCAPGEKFPAAVLAADDDLLLGETVLALGIPFGLGGSVSRGILSSKSRRPPSENEPLEIADWLQTDAAINPGNSGGPLIDLRGEVIGINVAVYREGQGIGFAIPIQRVTEAIAEIYTPEELKGLWFGARLKPGRLPLKVVSVQPASPAAQAGLAAGDAIVAIGGNPPRNLISFVNQLVNQAAKQAVPLTIQRGNERLQLSVRLVPEQTYFNAELIQQKIGATVQVLNDEVARRWGLGTTEGLLVASLEAQGPAAQAGIQRRFVVRAIDGTPTSDVVTAAKLLSAKQKGEKAVVTVLVERAFGGLIQTGTGEVEIKVR